MNTLRIECPHCKQAFVGSPDEEGNCPLCHWPLDTLEKPESREETTATDTEPLKMIPTRLRPLLSVQWKPVPGLEVYHYPEIPSLIAKKARGKLGSAMDSDEIPLLLFDPLGGPSWFWEKLPKLRPLFSFFERAGSVGLLITTKAIYEMCRGPGRMHDSMCPDYERSWRLPLHLLHSVQLVKGVVGDKILLNHIPLFGLLEKDPTAVAEIQTALYNVLSDLHGRLCHDRSPSLADIVQSYIGFGLVSSKDSTAKVGIERATTAYSQYDRDRDEVLYHKYEKGFLTNERQFLITDRNVFSYSIIHNHAGYNVWDISTINDVSVDYKLAFRDNTVVLGINDVKAYATLENMFVHKDESYGSRGAWRPEVMIHCYKLAAMICAIVNASDRSLLTNISPRIDSPKLAELVVGNK